ncbi:unnamed protein product [Penicillium bialowiezense]
MRHLDWLQYFNRDFILGNDQFYLRVVTVVTLAYFLYRLVQNRRTLALKSLKACGDQHGCLPMQTWIPYKWPLALDILKRQYDASSEQQLLLFQSQYFNKLGPNMTFKLFGNQGYLTADPKNVEAILSTNFEGIMLCAFMKPY